MFMTDFNNNPNWPNDHQNQPPITFNPDFQNNPDPLPDANQNTHDSSSTLAGLATLPNFVNMAHAIAAFIVVAGLAARHYFKKHNTNALDGQNPELDSDDSTIEMSDDEKSENENLDADDLNQTIEARKDTQPENLHGTENKENPIEIPENLDHQETLPEHVDAIENKENDLEMPQNPEAEEKAPEHSNTTPTAVVFCGGPTFGTEAEPENNNEKRQEVTVMVQTHASQIEPEQATKSVADEALDNTAPTLTPTFKTRKPRTPRAPYQLPDGDETIGQRMRNGSLTRTCKR